MGAILGILSCLGSARTEAQEIVAHPAPQPPAHWQPVSWSALPQWAQQEWPRAWSAWIDTCGAKRQPHPALPRLCRQVRALALATQAEQQEWLQQHFLPYAVGAQGAQTGLLTGYFEPELPASRHRSAQYPIALHRPPPGLAHGALWYSRAQMATHPQAQAALAEAAIAYIADPLDALAAQIQGSVRLRLSDEHEASGEAKTIRLSFAATNNHPYQSVGHWLREQGLLHDTSWPSIRAWAQSHPQRIDELLQSNPRYVFFRETSAAGTAPVGALGVPLTAMHSIAVDPRSIPYGLPVWLHTQGSTLETARLVMAQDTGAAIVGAVRADLFVGTGEAAAQVAGQLRQPLRMWVLWPRE